MTFLSRTITRLKEIRFHRGALGACKPAPVEGRAWVEHGQIRVTDPEHGGRPALMIVPDRHDLRVCVNGKRVLGMVEVRASDRVEVALQEKAPVCECTLEVHDKPSHVRLRVRKHAGLRSRLRDTAPAVCLLLETEGEVIPPEPINAQRLQMLMEERGLRGVEMSEAVLDMLERADGEAEVILPLSSSMSPRRPPYQLLEHIYERDDVFRTVRLRYVTSGTAIAVCTPEFSSQLQNGGNNDGYRLGDGVQLVDRTIVATRHGRVTVHRSLLDVVPETIIQRDVDFHEHIELEGNVIIQGSVHEGAMVRATGAVRVYGNVIGGEIHSAGPIQVRGHISRAVIIAGEWHHAAAGPATLPESLSDIGEHVNRLLAEYRILLREALGRFDRSLVESRLGRLLLTQRHPELIAQLNALSEAIRQIPITAFQQLRVEIDRIWSLQALHPITESDIVRLYEKLRTCLDTLAGFTTTAGVRASSIGSSTVMAKGHVIVSGRGVMASSLESGGWITIRGAAKGGFLTARKAICVDELGSVYAVETSLRVLDEDGVIRIRIRHPNTLVDVGGWRDRNRRLERNVYIRGGERSHEHRVGV